MSERENINDATFLLPWRRKYNNSPVCSEDMCLERSNDSRVTCDQSWHKGHVTDHVIDM